MLKDSYWTCNISRVQIRNHTMILFWKRLLRFWERQRLAILRSQFWCDAFLRIWKISESTLLLLLLSFSEIKLSSVLFSMVWICWFFSPCQPCVTKQKRIRGDGSKFRERSSTSCGAAGNMRAHIGKLRRKCICLFHSFHLEKIRNVI